MPHANALGRRKRCKATLAAGCIAAGEDGISSRPDGCARGVMGVAGVGAHAVSKMGHDEAGTHAAFERQRRHADRA